MLDTHKITKKMKDGSYFEDAKDWYFQKYVFPITERAMVFFAAGFVLIMACIIAINIRLLISVPERIPFVVYTPNSLDNFSLIQSLATKNTTPQEAVAHYLLTDYLRSREEFIPSQMDNKNFPYLVKKIKSSSSKAVLNEFKGYMSNMNPYSPFVRYHDGVTRTIVIKKLDFLTSDLTTGKAVIQFEAIETSKDKKDNRSMWEAVIHYRLPDIENIARTQAPLRFLVRYYKAKLLTN
jgi:type IV secretory pathway component VirB8